MAHFIIVFLACVYLYFSLLYNLLSLNHDTLSRLTIFSHQTRYTFSFSAKLHLYTSLEFPSFAYKLSLFCRTSALYLYCSSLFLDCSSLFFHSYCRVLATGNQNVFEKWFLCCFLVGTMFPAAARCFPPLCRHKQSIFSLSIFGILVERLSLEHLHFWSDFVTVFLFSSSMQGLKYFVTDFLISTCQKSYA